MTATTDHRPTDQQGTNAMTIYTATTARIVAAIDAADNDRAIANAADAADRGATAYRNAVVATHRIMTAIGRNRAADTCETVRDAARDAAWHADIAERSATDAERTDRYAAAMRTTDAAAAAAETLVTAWRTTDAAAATAADGMRTAMRAARAAYADAYRYAIAAERSAR
jgi:hypothetical protein